MADVKWFEIRDKGTFIPVMAVLVSERSGYLAMRAGFGEQPCIQLVEVSRGKTTYDPYDWNSRTLTTAHLHIQEHWDTLKDQDVVDVEYILGEREAPKVSERGGA